MADSLNALIRLLISATYIKDLDLADPKDVLALNFEQAFAPGTGSGLADLMFRDTRQLADGASENLDLSGSLSSAFGASLLFAKVKVLIIKNLSAAQILSVGGAASLGFVSWVGDPTDIVKVGAGGFLCLVNPAGYAVTAGTADLLKILNSAGAVCDYDIIIIGSSA